MAIHLFYCRYSERVGCDLYLLDMIVLRFIIKKKEKISNYICMFKKRPYICSVKKEYNNNDTEFAEQFYYYFVYYSTLATG